MYPTIINMKEELIICDRLQKYNNPTNSKSLCHNIINPIPNSNSNARKVKPNTIKLSINPRNQTDVCKKDRYKNFNTPKKPILSTTAANKTLISVVTSTCISGNHTCKGHIGYFIANITNKSNQI
eukprot:gene12702-8664_t